MAVEPGIGGRGPEREGQGVASMPGLGENYAHRFGTQFDSFRELPEPHAIGNETHDSAWDGAPLLEADPTIVGADLDDYEPIGESTRRSHTGWRDRIGFSGTNEAAYQGETAPGRDIGAWVDPRNLGTITREKYYRIDANEDEQRRRREQPR